MFNGKLKMKVGKGKNRQPKNDFSISLKTCAWLAITSAIIKLKFV